MKTIYHTHGLVLLLAMTACTKDIVVKDIKAKNVVVNAPSENLLTTSNQVTFWWEALDGAEKYNLQIVKPNFSAITKIVCDTTLYGTKYNFTLQPGAYQWRIKAINNGGSSQFQTYNLRVDTTSNLSGQLVSTLLPVSNFLSGNRRVEFSWNSLNAALQYQLLVLNSAQGVVKDTVTTSTQFTYLFPALSGTYTWKVRAMNNTSVSQYNSPLSFTLDLSPPAASNPTAPVASGTLVATITTTGTLGWSRVGAPDAKYDSLFIATDSLFANTFSKTRTYQLSIPLNTVSNPPSTPNTYYWWRLRSIDSVGNYSSYSAQQKFKLIP